MNCKNIGLYLIIFISIMLIVRILVRCVMKDEIEGMADISPQDLEAIKNISSIMNNGTGTLTDLNITNNLTVEKDLTVNNDAILKKNIVLKNATPQITVDNNGTITLNGNIKVNGNIEVTGDSNLGKWKIRNDKIGIPNRGDIHLRDDKWILYKEYGTDNRNAKGIDVNELYANNRVYVGGTPNYLSYKPDGDGGKIQFTVANAVVADAFHFPRRDWGLGSWNFSKW